MAESRIVKFNARDELPLTALLTLPRNVAPKKPAVGGDRTWWPMGTGVRVAVGRRAQFLASRGYAVIQPELSWFGGPWCKAFAGELPAMGVSDAGRHH